MARKKVDPPTATGRVRTHDKGFPEKEFYVNIGKKTDGKGNNILGSDGKCTYGFTGTCWAPWPETEEHLMMMKGLYSIDVQVKSVRDALLLDCRNKTKTLFCDGSSDRYLIAEAKAWAGKQANGLDLFRASLANPAGEKDYWMNLHADFVAVASDEEEEGEDVEETVEETVEA